MTNKKLFMKFFSLQFAFSFDELFQEHVFTIENCKREFINPVTQYH